MGSTVAVGSAVRCLQTKKTQMKLMADMKKKSRLRRQVTLVSIAVEFEAEQTASCCFD